MSLVRGLFDRLILVAGVLVGGCVPGFIAQYVQRVGGMLDQVKQDLLPFREVAQRYHGGDLHALVTHHLASPDRSFQDEGKAIENMLDSLARLQGMVDGLAGSVWHQIGYLLAHFDRAIGGATWHSYVPSFNLDPESLMVAGAFGVACWLLFVGLWLGISRLADLIVLRVFGARRY
jgi:Protein of unknown function (DUF2937)